MKKIRKQIILLSLTLLFIILACNAVSAAEISDNSTIGLSSNNSTDQPSNVVISGQVLKCSNGDPFPGVTVTASKDGTKLASTTTKEDGTYNLSFLVNSSIFTITASYPGHNPSSKEVTVSPGQNNTNYGTADFQLGVSITYVDDNWAGLPAGTVVFFPGDPNPHVIGTDAFSTISNGISNANSGGTAHIADGTYTGAGNTGITINKDITIIGQSQTGTIINGSNSARIFLIQGKNVTIQNLTIANGNINSGGAIINIMGNLTVTNCTFTGNTASMNGGAIYNSGTLNVTNSTFTNNTATVNGGAIYINSGTLNETSNTFTNNTATQSGGAIYINSGSLTDTNSTFNGNKAIYGGAIFNNIGGLLTTTNSTFTGNNATTLGGAIFNFKGQPKVNFCRIIGNTGTDIYNSNGSVNAEDNWWGSNFNGTSPQLAGRINSLVNTWIVLTVTANPTTINNGGISTIMANLLYDNGVLSDPTHPSSYYHDPINGHVPDGILVTFTGTLGSLNPISTTLLSGQAQSLFTANSAGTAVINATVDNQTVSTQLTVDQTPTTVTVDHAQNYAGQTVDLTAYVNANGSPIGSVGSVTFTVNYNGNTVNAGTASVNSGVATLTTWSIPSNWNVGQYTITADFNGTGTDYANSTGTGTLTVEAIPTSLTVSDAGGSGSFKGQTVNILATLRDTAHGNALVDGKTIDFTIAGDPTVYHAITGANGSSHGVATLVYQIVQDAGIYSIHAAFAGDTQYLASSSNPNGTLTVDKIPTNLTVDNVTGNKGETVNLKATLTDYYGKPISGKTITFKVNNDTVTGSATTDANGVATLPYTINLVGGSYTINAEFSADNQYVGSTGNGTLKVPQSNVYIQIIPSKINPTVGENIVITVKVGNYGPDAAQGVIVAYTVPSGFEFVNVSADAGINPVYDPATRTVTWNLGNVPVGDPYMYVTLKAVSSGAFDNIARIIGEITYDPNTGNKASSIAINVQQPIVPNVNAASKTIPMQETGLPLAGLVLAILAVFGGLVMPKRKN